MGCIWIIKVVNIVFNVCVVIIRIVYIRIYFIMDIFSMGGISVIDSKYEFVFDGFIECDVVNKIIR
jgi:hypothetical protein